MKIILSRKGFDSEYGGIPSPVLPDGTMISMPIPSRNDNYNFKDLSIKGITYKEILKQLNPSRRYTKCHLDPDIRKNICKRSKNWVPAFGQIGAAETHLENNDVKVGDIFLFFGWFRLTEYKNGKLRYVPKFKDKHMLYGYLQVGKIVTGKETLKYKWHPHSNRNVESNNTMYVASKKLVIDNKNIELNGAGVFKYSKNVVLTKEGESRSRWALPDIFKKVTISHHKKNSFKNGYFQSVHIGQEFVVSENKEITKWVKQLIKNNVV